MLGALAKKPEDEKVSRERDGFHSMKKDVARNLSGREGHRWKLTGVRG